MGGIFTIFAGALLTWIFYSSVLRMYSGSNDIIQKLVYSSSYDISEISFNHHDFPFMPFIEIVRNADEDDLTFIPNLL